MFIFHMFGCIKLHRVPVPSEPPSPRQFEGAHGCFGVSCCRHGQEFQGARPSPGTYQCPGGYGSDSDHLAPRHAPTMPACLTGHAPPPRCCCRGEEAVGDGHPDYNSSYGLFTVDTKRRGERSVAPQRQTFRFVVSFPQRSRVLLVAHVTLCCGPIGWRRSSSAE